MPPTPAGMPLWPRRRLSATPSFRPCDGWNIPLCVHRHNSRPVLRNRSAADDLAVVADLVIVRAFARRPGRRCGGSLLTIAPKACAMCRWLLSRFVPPRIRGAPATRAARGPNALLPSIERTIGQAGGRVAAGGHRAKMIIKKGLLLSASQVR